jgi:hypothetical protein
MVTEKATGKKTGKLKLKKETIKDLDPRAKVNGGIGGVAMTQLCPTRPVAMDGGTGTFRAPGPIVATSIGGCGRP